MSVQETSFENTYASRAQRIEPADSLDDFPTPVWATRALCEHILTDEPFDRLTCWEPAAGRGTMVRPLSEYLGHVYGSDIHDYGFGFDVADFLEAPARPVDWVVTNPPFKGAEAAIDPVERTRRFEQRRKEVEQRKAERQAKIELVRYGAMT